MLGFSPIAAQPISGSPFSLIRITASLSASIPLGFSLSGRMGAFTPVSAGIGVSFSLGPTLWVNQALQAQVPFAFTLSPLLRNAGKPIVLRAVPQAYYARSPLERFTAKALPSRYTTRGAK
jgi:hypothetical protein